MANSNFPQLISYPSRISGDCCTDGVGRRRCLRLTNIQLSAGGAIRTGNEVRHCKDQRPDGHEQHSEADPSGLAGGGTSPEVRQRDEDTEAGKVVGAGHRCELRRLEVEATLDCGDADVN